MELGTERAPLSLWKWEVEPLLQTLCFVPLKRKKVNQQQFLLKFRSSSYEKKITTGTTKWTTWTKWCCPDQSPDGIPGPWLWTSMCAGWGSVWRLKLLFLFLSPASSDWISFHNERFPHSELPSRPLNSVALSFEFTICNSCQNGLVCASVIHSCPSNAIQE